MFNPVAVESFPEGEVARDIGAHVLPRREGGHVVVVFYHTYYKRKFNSAIGGQLSHVRSHQHTIFLFAFFFHSSIFVIALENISEPVKHARDGGYLSLQILSFGRTTLPAERFIFRVKFEQQIFAVLRRQK